MNDVAQVIENFLKEPIGLISGNNENIAIGELQTCGISIEFEKRKMSPNQVCKEDSISVGYGVMYLLALRTKLNAKSDSKCFYG